MLIDMAIALGEQPGASPAFANSSGSRIDSAESARQARRARRLGSLLEHDLSSERGSTSTLL